MSGMSIFSLAAQESLLLNLTDGYGMRKMRILVMMVIGGMMCGCGTAGEEKVSMGPEETVRAFYQAMTSGDFSTAAELSDSVSMNPYITEYQTRLEAAAKADSSVAAIASSLLSGATVNVAEVHKEGDRRHVHYSIEVGMDLKKEKM